MVVDPPRIRPRGQASVGPSPPGWAVNDVAYLPSAAVAAWLIGIRCFGLRSEPPASSTSTLREPPALSRSASTAPAAPLPTMM